MTISVKTARSSEPPRPMTEEEVLAAAWSDPDGQPLTADDFARMKRVPRVKIIRRALKLTPEEFEARFGIPADVVRAWEAGASVPDAVAEAYLRVISREPEAVAAAIGQAARGTREAAE